VIALVLATRLSALEVLRNICNMGTHDLLYMYACLICMPAGLGLWAYISGKLLVPMLQLYNKVRDLLADFLVILETSLNLKDRSILLCMPCSKVY